MSRSINRGLVAATLAMLGSMSVFSSNLRAADSATIVPGGFIQGTVKTSLQAAGYTNTNINLGAWPLNTGGNFAISFANPQFQANTLIAVGNGGSIELKFNTPITPVPGEKDLGIFTAQAITGGAYAFNGNMEAAILVSSDGQNWFTLTGVKITSPTTYTGITYPLNAPTMAYDYGTDATAWQAGGGSLSASQLAALSIANFTTPMPDDTLFNNPASTNAQRNALTTDSSAADYTEEFGTSGGGNWFDVSGSGLSSINYVMLNGDANEANNLSGPSSGGIRLEDVFANASAVPEPASLALLALGGAMLLKRRR